MSTPTKVVKSPYRFDPWTLSISENVKCFKAWISSLRTANALDLGAVGWVLLSPVLGIVALFVTPWYWQTVVFSVSYFLLVGWSLMLIYHRMLSHRAFVLHPAMKTLMLVLCSAGMEGPALGWVKNHRAHHRYLDTEKDPYDATRGLWWSHMGWALHPHDPELFVDVDMSDLTSDPEVVLQQDYYMTASLLLAFIFPTLFCGLLWGDYAGGFWLGGMLRAAITLQTAFFVNSFAHWSGDHTYDDNMTPVDSVWAHILTTGEGFHNFHHAFPYDYRGTSDRWAIDPLKWLTYGLYMLGLASDLKRHPEPLIQHAKLEMARKKIDRAMGNISIFKDEATLPHMTTSDVKRRVQEGAMLIIVKGLVYDIHEFLPQHPGGEPLLRAYLGKDATPGFYGTLTKHTHGAQQLLASLVVAKIVDSPKED